MSNVRRHILRSLGIASVAGLIAAMPIVLLVVTSPNWLPRSAEFIVVPLILVCPPWELFWATIGRPDDTSFLIRVCGAVLVLNAVLYAPLGVLHAFTLRVSPPIQRTLVGITYLCLLAFGHMFFLQ